MLTKKQVIMKLTNGQHEADVHAFDSEGYDLLITITAHDIDRLEYSMHHDGNAATHCFKSPDGDDYFCICYWEPVEC